PKPASLDHVQAAAVPLAGLTAWQILIDTANVKPGQRVLIHAAAGGVGHLAVQFARHLGAHVIATATSAKHGWLRHLGAAETIDYTAASFEEMVKDVDVVVDLVGDEHASTSTRSLRVLKPGGLLVAVPSGVSPDLSDRAQAAGVCVTPFLVEPDGAALPKIASLIDQGAVSVEVERVLPLDQAAEAHRRGEQGHTRGKLVLDLQS
ncbi:NADP-dependent oxidoreductase, partial [Nonomuraea turkmeniaca]